MSLPMFDGLLIRRNGVAPLLRRAVTVAAGITVRHLFAGIGHENS
jgi:hypothetical protein